MPSRGGHYPRRRGSTDGRVLAPSDAVADTSGVSNRVYAFRSPDPLGTWLRRLLGAQIFVTTFTALDGYLGWRTATFVIYLGDRARPPEIPAWQPPIIGAIAPLVGLATIVVWLTWQHRVRANVWASGIAIRTTPGWAVGWWFVPIGGGVHASDRGRARLSSLGRGR